MCSKLAHVLAVVVFGVAFANGQSATSPDLSCTMDHQCTFMYGDHSQCVKHKCVCWDINEKVNTRCVYKSKSPKVTVLGFSCETDATCKPEHSVCDPIEKHCVCPDEFNIESADRRRCLAPIATINSSCQDSNQCAAIVQHMICQESTCVCEDFFNYHNDTCIARSALHGGCFNDGNCKHVTNSQCEDRTCTCSAGYVPEMDGMKCLQVAHRIGDSCQEHHQCEFNLGKGSACLEKTCRCREEYIENDDRTHCKNVPYVGMECYETEDCNIPRRDGATNSMICSMGSCECSSDHFQKDQKCFLTPSSSDKCSKVGNTVLLAGLILKYLF